MVLFPTTATTLLWELCIQCNIWPGMNLGLNLTGVVCYWTPPDVGTQLPDNRRGILWSSASLSTTAENYTSYCTMEDCNKVQKI